METTSFIIDEVERRNNRQCNLIFTGIPEAIEGSVEERKEEDRSSFGRVMKELGF